MRIQKSMPPQLKIAWYTGTNGRGRRKKKKKNVASLVMWQQKKTSYTRIAASDKSCSPYTNRCEPVTNLIRRVHKSRNAAKVGSRCTIRPTGDVGKKRKNKTIFLTPVFFLVSRLPIACPMGITGDCHLGVRGRAA